MWQLDAFWSVFSLVTIHVLNIDESIGAKNTQHVD